MKKTNKTNQSNVRFTCNLADNTLSIVIWYQRVMDSLKEKNTKTERKQIRNCRLQKTEVYVSIFPPQMWIVCRFKGFLLGTKEDERENLCIFTCTQHVTTCP